MSLGADLALPAGCIAECPGCAHRSWPRLRSLDQKSGWLRRRLAFWGDALSPIQSSDTHAWGYRNKTCLSAEWDPVRSFWKFGLKVASKEVSAKINQAHRRVSWIKKYEVLDIPDCPIHSESVRLVAREFSRKLPGPDVLPLVFLSISGRMATLVVKSKKIPAGTVSANNVFQGILARINPAELGLEGVFINANPGAGERVFSSRGWHLIWGKDRTLLRLDAGEFLHGPESFQQLIPTLYQAALEEAAGFLNPGPGDSVVDLCSGIGVSLRKWRSLGARALGVELNGEAVSCAAANAGPGSCLQGRASERIPQLQVWAQEGGKRGRVLVFANPPRLGLEPEVATWLGTGLRPASIAYLSCSAGTLARDLLLLQNSGYRVKRIVPYDFFPQTPHVEALALVERLA